jgi:hypothetical protein
VQDLGRNIGRYLNGLYILVAILAVLVLALGVYAVGHLLLHLWG